MKIEVRLSGASSNKEVGVWNTGIDNVLTIKSEESMKNISAATIYRVLTVVVSYNYISISSILSSIAIYIV